MGRRWDLVGMDFYPKKDVIDFLNKSYLIGVKMLFSFLFFVGVAIYLFNVAESG